MYSISVYKLFSNVEIQVLVKMKIHVVAVETCQYWFEGLWKQERVVSAWKTGTDWKMQSMHSACIGTEYLLEYGVRDSCELQSFQVLQKVSHRSFFSNFVIYSFPSSSHLMAEFLTFYQFHMDFKV